MCKKEKKEILRILLPPIFTFLLNSVVYWGAPLIKTGIVVHNLSSSVDRIVPFMPQFIIIYFGCYIFWVVNYLLIAAQKEEHRYQFFTADFYARLICFVCFVFFPTTNTNALYTNQVAANNANLWNTVIANTSTSTHTCSRRYTAVARY